MVINNNFNIDKIIIIIILLMYYIINQSTSNTFTNSYDQIQSKIRHLRHLPQQWRLEEQTEYLISRTENQVTELNPLHVLFPLPTVEGKRVQNPFGITISLVEPIVDIALDDVYQNNLVPRKSIEVHFKDTKLSDAHGPNVAINQLVEGKLDCMIGFAYVYALAPVARMSPYWKKGDGIPLITTIGLTSNLDNKAEYKMLTRIMSPYKVLTRAILHVFDRMGWLRVTYVFHEQRYGSTSTDSPYGECYLQMASLQPLQYKKNKMDHNYFLFNELKYDRIQMRTILMKASAISNG